jgi:hypothetical protein
MNLEDQRAEEYLETIYLRASQLSTKANELKKVIQGNTPEGVNPFELPKELAPLKREIDNAWDALHAIKRVRHPAVTEREFGGSEVPDRRGGTRQLGTYDG